MPLETSASAVSRISFSLMSVPQRFQLFQPMGGVGARARRSTGCRRANRGVATSTSRASPQSTMAFFFFPVLELHHEAELLDARQRHADPGRLPRAAAAGRPCLLGNVSAIEGQLAIGVDSDGDGAVQGPTIRPHPGLETAVVPRNVVDYFAIGLHSQAALEAFPAGIQLAPHCAGIDDDPARLPLRREVIEINTRLFDRPKVVTRQATEREKTQTKNDTSHGALSPPIRLFHSDSQDS